MISTFHRARSALASLSFVLGLAGFAHAQQPFAPTFDTVLDTSQNGGLFTYSSVTIPAGVTVRGIGPNPLIVVSLGDVRIDGRLRVDGDDGRRRDVLQSANFPTPGGAGNCGGGNGGNGSPSSISRSFLGGPGLSSPLFGAPTGGLGGAAAIVPSVGRASGGGGGSFSTLGDPFYGFQFVPLILWPQVFGDGGPGGNGPNGAVTRTLPGGSPGASVFQDGRPENDHFGTVIDVARLTLVPGELPVLCGGGGGGGGGDRAANQVPSQFPFDEGGGGGGGGAGALVVISLQDIEVGPSGSITADGGDGGGGEQAGSNNRGGGGGGGAGGMVLLYAEQTLRLHVSRRVSTGSGLARDGDYLFSVSAQGGVGTQGAFGALPIEGKYGAAQATLGSGAWNNNPAGGFGGLGLIQLYTRPGINADGTNTLLDDGIEIVDQGVVLHGAQKQAALAWRGFVQPNGTTVDDSGNSLDIGSAIGDIHPTPILIPIL